MTRRARPAREGNFPVGPIQNSPQTPRATAPTVPGPSRLAASARVASSIDRFPSEPMDRPLQPPSAAPHPHSTREPFALPLMLLVAHAERRQWLRELLQRIDPRLQPVHAPSLGEAVDYLTVVRPQILVLDLALDDDPDHSAALRLARLSPATVVLAFSDAPTQRPNPARHGWSWADAEPVLKASIETWLRADGVQRPPEPPR